MALWQPAACAAPLVELLALSGVGTAFRRCLDCGEVNDAPPERLFGRGPLFHCGSDRAAEFPTDLARGQLRPQAMLIEERECFLP
jgi:hypothetical protein